MTDFYITYRNNARNSGNYPYDLEMGCLENQEISEAHILEYLKAIVKYEDYNDLPSNHPILITSDKELHFKYKHVLNYREFMLFCNSYDNYEKLPCEDKILVDAGVPGQFGIRTFYYFERLVAGEGKWAYQYFSKESFYDEDNGNSYSMDVDTGWKMKSTFWYNEDLKKRYRI